MKIFPTPTAKGHALMLWAPKSGEPSTACLIGKCKHHPREAKRGHFPAWPQGIEPCIPKQCWERTAWKKSTIQGFNLIPDKGISSQSSEVGIFLDLHIYTPLTEITGLYRIDEYEHKVLWTSHVLPTAERTQNRGTIRITAPSPLRCKHCWVRHPKEV